ncbi:MAG: hypothetical protein MRY83_16610 [Flavobacteriales bacterium]|nr:hypothetical protein [Flavobacteriales bacterium]
MGRYFKYCVSALFILVLIGSCQKSKLNKNTISSEDNLLVMKVLYNIVFSVEKELLSSEDLYKTSDVLHTDCAQLSVNPPDSGIWPKNFVVDFGRENCLGIDDIQRRGQIVGTIDSNLNASSVNITIDPSAYVQDNHSISGTISFTKSNAELWNIEATNLVLTKSNLEEVSWEGSLARTRTSNSQTDFSLDPENDCYQNVNCIFDDIFELTGSAKGINHDGRKFDFTIKDGIRIEYCQLGYQMTSGSMELQPEDLRLRKIDFGNNNCDNTATVIIANRDYRIAP